MLFSRNLSVLRQNCVAYRNFQTCSLKHVSKQVTFNLETSKSIHGSTSILSGLLRAQHVGCCRLPECNRQFSMLSASLARGWELRTELSSFPTNTSLQNHFKPCRNIHTTSRSSESEKGENANTDGSRGNNALGMSTRIKIVTFLIATWAVVYFAANYNKEKKKVKERDSELKQVDIGASDYELVDQYGRKRTKSDFLGQWFLLYFGFTHCPDICPEELEKMAGIIDIIDSNKTIPNLLPVFVSVDPERDTPQVIGKYVAEFHKNFVGLTGSKEQIKQATKAFRVYFSAGPRDEDNDYIVDHSIVMYLMNPQGNFVDYYGSRGVPTEKIVESIKQNMKNYKRFHG